MPSSLLALLPLHSSLQTNTRALVYLFSACTISMARGRPRKIKCPLPLCPAPKLFVGKSGSQFHCVGCWRKFAPGDTGSLCKQLSRQVPPPTWMLTRCSPHQLASGPPPLLFQSPHGTSQFADDDDPASRAHDGPDTPDVADTRGRYALDSSSENCARSSTKMPHTWKEWRFYRKGDTGWRFKRETIECEGCSECAKEADNSYHKGYTAMLTDESD